MSKFIKGIVLSGFGLGFIESAHAANTIVTSIDDAFGVINGYIASVLFFNLLTPFEGMNLPFAVALLIFGAVYFTFKLKFINFRAFGHAIEVVRGKYDDPEDVGEVTHFQALTTALSATVGLGNIAGVAIAVSIGGPGATFWMIMAGLLGMSAKFAECTLAQMYREVRPDGHVMGGAMEYLSRGLKDLGLPRLGMFLAYFFSIACVLASFGGGTSFQVKQSLSAAQQTIPFFAEWPAVYGLIMVVAVGVVIIGGIKRIAHTAEAIVPLMCGIYILTCGYVLLAHFTDIPWAIGEIISGAFTSEAGLGGLIGVLVQGFKRAAFSNEAGIGSAAIAHSAARTHHPAREGVVALLEPFIDTVVICTMTALVIVITGAYNDPMNASLIAANQGAALTSKALGSVVSWFPYILSIAVILFAYSTMISWSYYGERCWTYMFGESKSMIYKVLVLGAVFLGSITSATNVLDFSDLMIFFMAVPNVIGVLILRNKIKESADHYMDLLKSGQFAKELSAAADHRASATSANLDQ